MGGTAKVPQAGTCPICNEEETLVNAIIFGVLWILLTVIGSLLGVRVFRRVHPVLVGLASFLGSGLVLYGTIVVLLSR